MKQRRFDGRSCVIRNLRSERGIALVTVVLLLVILTVLGIAALTVTGMEGRMAGFMRTGEAVSTAAEACLDTGMKVIQETIDVQAGGQLPAALRSDATPAGPVPAGNAATLQAELLGQDDNNSDTPNDTTPNVVINTVPGHSVTGDIDRLYAQTIAGSSQAFDEAANASIEIIYRVDCVSSNNTTGASSRIVGVYACTLNADGCQRQL